MRQAFANGRSRAIRRLTVLVVVAGALAAPGVAHAATSLRVVTVIPNVQSGSIFQVQVEALLAGGTRDTAFSGNITLTAAATGGSNFTAGNVQAATQGLATFNVSLSNAANGYTIAASSPGLTSPASNSFNVTATHLAVLAIGNVRAGDPFNVTVQARDANNITAENFTGNVSINASATGGSNFNGGTPAVGAVAGAATFNSLVLNNAANNYTVTAASAGLTNGLSNTFNVTARQLVVTSVISNLQAGAGFNVSVEARDGNNAVAENFSGSVSLNASATGGSNFNGGTPAVGAVAGAATFNSLVLNDAANNYTVTATSTGLISGASNSFNVTATHLAVSAIGNVRSGDSFNVTVQARDANNITAENFTGNVSINASATGGSNFNGGTPAVGAVAGAATFNSLVLNNAANNYTVTAASAGLTNGLSNTFNVTARQLVVTSVISNLQAGAGFNVSVEARDGNNAVAENFNGAVSLTAAAPAGGSSFASPISQSAVAGSVTFSSLQLLNAANNYTVTAASTGLINGASNSFNTTAILAIQAFGNPRSGDAFNVEVRAVDAQPTPQVAENFSGSIGLELTVPPGGSPFVTAPDPKASAGGVATFDGLTLLNAADGYELDANGAGPVTGSRLFDVGPSQLVFMTPSSVRVAGQPFGVQLEARDAQNNLAEDFDGPVQLSAAAPGAGANFAGGTKTTNGAGGVVTFGGLKLDRAARDYSLSAAAGEVSTASDAFDVVADVMSRRLTLKLSGRFASGVVKAGSGPRCRSGMIVRVQRKSGRRWVTVGIDTTNSAGAYREPIGNRRGTYRAVTPRATWPSPTTACLAATSPTKVKR